MKEIKQTFVRDNDVWKLGQNDMEMVHPFSRALYNLVGQAWNSGSCPIGGTRLALLPFQRRETYFSWKTIVRSR